VLFLPRERGQGLAEYAFILVFVIVLLIVFLLIIGPAVGDMYSSIVNVI
jgi:pilus assembly protein Flp/PilA